MAVRYVALTTEAPRAWRKQFATGLDPCDWWICAEWAGIDDDDEARVAVRPLTAAKPKKRGSDAVVDFGSAGLLRVRAVEGDECAHLREEYGAPAADGAFGFVFTIEGSAGVAAKIIGEATQAIAIGMVGTPGWVRVPNGAWWDTARKTWSR